MKAYKLLASASKKNIVLMSVKSNLISAERAADLKLFQAPWFTTKAMVAMGPPPTDFTKAVKAKVLDGMKAVLEKKVNIEKESFEREQSMKQKKAEQDAKMKNMVAQTEYKKKKATWDKLTEAGETEKAGDMPTEPEEVAVVFEKAEEPDWAAKMKIDEAEVKDIIYRPRQAAGVVDATGKFSMEDIPKEMVGRLFNKFTIPVSGKVAEVPDVRWLPEGEEPKVQGEGEPEGFGSVEFAWAPKAKAEAYLGDFKKGRKVQDKFLELQPGPYCKEVLEKWSLKKVEMRRILTEYLLAKKKRAAKKAELEKAKDEPMEEKKEEEKTETNGEVKTEEVKEEKEEEKKEEKKEPELDMTVDDDAPDVDVDKPDDVNSVDGKGTPLYKNFGPEDWLLAQLRFEMHHLVRSFSTDVTAKDPDRRGIIPSLLPHYYYVFFEKALHPTTYGQESMEALLEYVQDTVELKDDVLVVKHDADMPDQHIVRVTEEGRRDRSNRIAAGDESAKLKFARTTPTPAAPKGPPGKGAWGAPGKGYAPGPRPQAPYGQPYGKGYVPPSAAGVKRPYGATYGPGPAVGGIAKRPMMSPPFKGKGKY